MREGDVVTPEELIGEKWLDGPIYRDYLKPLDVRYLLGADFYTPDGIECRLRITRPHGAPPFGEDERALVRFVLPHLKRSLRRQVREESLECDRQMLAGTVNRMAERKSVVKGKSVSVRVDLGGRRIIKKKKTKRTR